MDPDLWTMEPWASELTAAVSFLEKFNTRGRDTDVVQSLAQRLVYETAWAKNWRMNKRVRPDRTRRRTSNVSVLPRARSIAADMKRMLAALDRGGMAFALAWVEASPAAQARLSEEKPLTLKNLMNLELMRTLIERALASPDMKGRPRSDEIDRVAIAALIAFEALHGPATATRKEVFDPSDDTDIGRKAFSPAHQFLVEASRLVGLPLAGPGDDARLRRVLRVRSAAKT